MSDNKRKDPDQEAQNDALALVVKKQRTEDQALVQAPTLDSAKLQLIKGIQRTSSLLSPIMLLSGHQAEVFSCKFSPSGKHLASGSMDKTILLWDVYGECQNYLMLRGHQNAVLEVCWSFDERTLISASADKSVALWDVEVGRRIRKSHHASFVNACSYVRKGSPLYVSGSDDATIKLWDARSKGAIQALKDKFPTTSVCFSDDNSQIFSSGIDHEIKVWDFRKGNVWMELAGHTDSVTGIRLSPDGSYLLSTSMDNTVRIWDVRPFVKEDRCIKTFTGAQHSFEKILLKCSWSADGSKISSGSADRFVYVWDTASRKILYKLPGHRGSVNEVDFHPHEPIVGSCSNDQTIYLGEIKQ